MNENKAYQQVVQALSDFPSDPLDARLITLLEEFAATLANYQLSVPATSPLGLEKLRQTAPEVKSSMIRSFELWLEWIRPQGEFTGGTVLDLDRGRERLFAENALRHFNLRASEAFWDKMVDGQIIEIYSHDMIQLYRSLSFFKFCGYSLLDISLYEWYVLWDRPKRVLEMLVEQAKGALMNPIDCERIKNPRHVIREGFSTGLPHMKPRAYLAEFMQLGTLVDHVGRPVGFICTSEGEFLAEGAEAFSIQFV